MTSCLLVARGKKITETGQSPK